MTLADVVEGLLGPDLPVAFEAYDGSRLGPADAIATITVRSDSALRRIAMSPGELGFGRAYAAGDVELEGDIYAALSALRDRVPRARLSARQWVAVASLVGSAALRPPPRLPEEARLRGRRHGKDRDATAVAYHYDLSNRFYQLVLGASMTYSCALWSSPEVGLEAAQEAKHELVCRKLGLQPGMRLLDVGCGWGSLVMHAARHHGVRAVGVTLSAPQARWGEKQAVELGVADLVEVRRQDYRDVNDGPFDAICSIGMFEHVGLSQLGTYFGRLFHLLGPRGRLLNHGISRPPCHGRRRPRASFFERYVFPDGELHEVGGVVSAMQEAGLEVRHLESLREHYPLTLRAWVENLESGWDEAVEEVGLTRARIWRLYLAASALNFEANRTQVHQVLAVKPSDGDSGLPLRPAFN